ncbi:hypothetical protein [Cetobacterium somerae]|uniref:hypothetical protein n=1 Tax=Cetobacterium somerae TaxID=188913 RepID=UPI001F067300|nr:hypothetical protein [Cetobacterium somerae]UPO98443.1 hypothetical protein MKD34_09170 [Cetobacterium somerae]
MKRFKDSILNSLKEKNWYAALTVSLLIPDICGNLEFPHEQVGKRYKQWVEKYLQDKYTSYVGADRKKIIFLSAQDCYNLRCSLVHAGSDKVSDKAVKDSLSKFHFVIPDERLIIHNNLINDALQLDIGIFCRDMCNSLDEWLNDIDDTTKERFSNLLVIHDFKNGSIFF